ncbi:PhoD-like phosphatase [Planctomycetes bacterium Poly30]|uniref:PhoD-like phosphatase n=1 Tax=Saltatorellus ferox TaxID=2528018 RepID=A0A518EZF2_9BACT|nr:PhoD-like phosphatase [Planctomycetes bacterium Poly30]
MSTHLLLRAATVAALFSPYSTGLAAALQEVKPLVAAEVFGERFQRLESMAMGEWWNVKPNPRRTMSLDVPRDEVVAFALYTHDRGTLKLTAQLFPLYPDEEREVRLEFRSGAGEWELAATEKVIDLGWSAHFRLDGWDSTRDVEYRVRHGNEASFEGTVRRDPIDQDVLVVGHLSCNSSRTPGPRPTMLENLKRVDPDLLFFAGDQSYHHTEHTYGWLEFGVQFREILKDRPVITIPDDHDIGQSNLWGESGKQATDEQGPSGGYFFPAAYVNMVERCQTWHLPDAYDPAPIERGIGVYFTNLKVGGVDFAILEDRKFKSGPEGKIPKMGPRPDHINDPKYDRASVDLPELALLGDRQIRFLHEWGQDWSGAHMKCVLSQTAFCGAVHLHGSPENRLLADLDSNAWPQAGRNAALREIRRARAPHLCGDQHLAVVVKHGIDAFGDGPYAFTSPAIVNTIYGRWWWPQDEQPGPNPVEGSPLPWTGDYLDGLGNRISMMAYANPSDRTDEKQRADGFGVVRFDKKAQSVTVECWPRFADMSQGDAAQFPGWPITFACADNDGREPTGYLPVPEFVRQRSSAVVQVIEEERGEILYTVRMRGEGAHLPVYGKGPYTIRAGADRPDEIEVEGVQAKPVGDD